MVFVLVAGQWFRAFSYVHNGFEIAIGWDDVDGQARLDWVPEREVEEVELR